MNGEMINKILKYCFEIDFKDVQYKLVHDGLITMSHVQYEDWYSLNKVYNKTAKFVIGSHIGPKCDRYAEVEGIKPFIEDLCGKYDTDAYLVFIILHEVGHLYFVNNMVNKKNCKYIQEFEGIIRTFSSIGDLSLDTVKGNNNRQAMYKYQHDEVFADIYAYSRLPIILKMMGYPMIRINNITIKDKKDMNEELKNVYKNIEVHNDFTIPIYNKTESTKLFNKYTDTFINSITDTNSDIEGIKTIMTYMRFTYTNMPSITNKSTLNKYFGTLFDCGRILKYTKTHFDIDSKWYYNIICIQRIKTIIPVIRHLKDKGLISLNNEYK